MGRVGRLGSEQQHAEREIRVLDECGRAGRRPRQHGVPVARDERRETGETPT